MLQGDRFFALLTIRALTYGAKVAFSVPCQNDACRAWIEWDLDLGELPCWPLSYESRAAFTADNRFETVLPDSGKRVWFKPFTGADERRLPQLRRSVGDKLLSATGLPKASLRTAARLPLLTGMRSGEVRHLQVKDIDFNLGRIWIREKEEEEDGIDWDVKTADSKRSTDLPRCLREDLEMICRGRGGDELLFPSNRTGGRPFDRKWLNRLVREVCQRAGTRIVCCHGLRGTYLTLKKVEGRSDSEIASLAGHADHGETARKHYIGVPEYTPSLEVILGGKLTGEDGGQSVDR